MRKWFKILLATLLVTAVTVVGLRYFSQQHAIRPLEATIHPYPELGDREFAVGEYLLRWESAGGGQLRILRAADEAVVLQSIPGQAFMIAGVGDERVTESRGLFRMQDSRIWAHDFQTIDRLGWKDEAHTAVVIRGNSGAEDYTLEFSDDGNGGLAISGGMHEDGSNRAWLTFAAEPEERFFGFGEQFSFFDFSGRRVPILTSEQGIGRGAQPITAGANLLAGAGGDWSTSYAPVPHFITNKLRSFGLTSTGYSAFDLRTPGRVQVEIHGNTFSAALASADTVPDLLQHWQHCAGAMRPLPDWILDGAVVGMQGGTERVRGVWEQLKARDVPMAAFWLQDWQGQRKTGFGKQLWWNWELDDERYAGWDAMRDEMAAEDVRLMGYINCFLVDIEGRTKHDRNLFREAEAEDYLLRDTDGEVILIPNTDFSAGMIDLSNEEAREWIKQVIKDELIGAGLSGWMADFGEALPWEAQLKNGDAREWHNRYPVEWAQINREAIEEAGVGKEAVFFSRSGFTRSPAYSTLFWLGDQLVSWDEHDGIKTAVTGLLTSGLSGYVYNHSDIGGYTTVTNPLGDYHRSKELLMRWMELNAFTTIYRTHEGNDPDKNFQFYTDDETLTHFARFAKVYAAWADYRKALVREASETGLPVVRHPFIHYPQDPEIWDLSYQEFLVGEEMLVAPVLDPGVDTVRAYLPAGKWEHLWTGEIYGDDAAGRWVEVPAPLGEPGVFLKLGSATGESFKANLRAGGLLAVDDSE